MKLTYVVTLEEMPRNFGVCVPDVPGCVSTGRTREQALEIIQEALAFHIEAMASDGEPVPLPATSIDDAIASYSGPVPDDVLSSYAEFGGDAVTVPTQFERVEVEITDPRASLVAAAG